MDTPNNTSTPTPPTPAQNAGEAHAHDPSLVAILAYLGPLVIIPYLTNKDDAFVKFHVKQGFVLLIIQIILWVLMPMFLWELWGIIRIVHLALLVLSIIGIVNVVQKKQKMLPVVGSLTKYFKF